MLVNKKRVIQWLSTIECCLRTCGKEAFEIARKLKPDLIHVLGDGGFTDNAHEHVLKNPFPIGTQINTLGMNLDLRAAKRFEAIAKAHGGTYKDVGLTPDGRRALAQVGPRKANRTKGYVWGIKLPLVDKKKKN